MTLDAFEQKWDKKYQYAVRSWRTNRDDLTTFFDYPMEIRKIIYTTNLIENLNGKKNNIPKLNYHSPMMTLLKNLYILLLMRLKEMDYAN